MPVDVTLADPLLPWLKIPFPIVEVMFPSDVTVEFVSPRLKIPSLLDWIVPVEATLAAALLPWLKIPFPLVEVMLPTDVTVENVVP